MTLKEVVVAPRQTLGERWLQPRVTTCDVERVAVVGDRQQVAHRRLTGVSTILEAHVAALAELPAEVGCWTPVDNGAIGDGVGREIAVGEL